MREVKVLLADIDGVCTNGEKLVDITGKTIGKNFQDLNWSAFKRFKACGVIVEAMTGDPWNADILWNRQISYTLTRGSNKEDHLHDVCKRHNVSPEEIAYIGDDIFDIGIMKKVGFPFAPSNATQEVFIQTNAVRLTRKGGDNVIDELYYFLRENKLIPRLSFEEEYKKVIALDSKQVF